MLTPHNPFLYALEKDKLNGSNFLQWYQNPRIVLKQQCKTLKERISQAGLRILASLILLLSLNPTWKI